MVKKIMENLFVDSREQSIRCVKKEGTNKKYIDCIYCVKYLLALAGESKFGFWTKRNSVSGVRSELEMVPFLLSWIQSPSSLTLQSM